MGEKNYKTILGKKVRQLRRAAGMSQTGLADLLGYTSTGMISQIENGIKGMDQEKIRRLAEVFNVPEFLLMSSEDFSDDAMQMFMNLKKVTDSPDSPAFKIVQGALDAAIKQQGEP